MDIVVATAQAMVIETEAIVAGKVKARDTEEVIMEEPEEEEREVTAAQICEKMFRKEEAHAEPCASSFIE